MMQVKNSLECQIDCQGDSDCDFWQFGDKKRRECTLIRADENGDPPKAGDKSKSVYNEYTHGPKFCPGTQTPNHSLL